MIKCRLRFQFQASGKTGSCGLDFWQSPPAIDWINQYLVSQSAYIEVTDNCNKASLLCFIRPLPGGFFLASAYPYGCIDGDINLFWKAENHIAYALRKHRILRLEISFTGEFINQIATIPNSSKIIIPSKLEAVRHVLDLRPAISDPQWADKPFDSKIRWAMRKAVRSGATVEIAKSTDSAIIQNLYEETMRAKGAPVNYGEERFKGIITDLLPRGMGNIFIGYINQVPAGFAAIVQGQKSCHLIQIAVTPENQSARISELLIGTVINNAISKNITYFDFMASPKTDKGLIAFKAKWKGKSETIYHAILPVFPFFHKIIDLGRAIHKMKGRLNGN